MVAMPGLLPAFGRKNCASTLAGVFDTLSDRLQGALGDLRKGGRLDDEAISKAMREIRIPVYSAERADPVRATRGGIANADGDVVAVDTAGRLHVDEPLMEELAAVRREAKPTNVLLVLDAMTGQEAVAVAQAFQERVDFDGVVLTKLDGDARGGAALSVKAVTGKPIKLVSVGEKVDQLEYFHPDRMASRILGMGDVLSLIDGSRRQRIARGSGTSVEQVNQLLEARKQMAKVMKQMRDGKMPSLPGLEAPGAPNGARAATARKTKSKRKKKKKARR